MKFKFVHLILLISIFVTFIYLGKIPRAFYFDEAAFGYYGHSILKYGLDEFGNKFPLYFKSIGDYKYPLYVYLTTLPTLFFGLGIFSARFVSAVSGILIVLYIYLYSKDKNLLPKSKTLLGLSFIFLLSSPWYLLFARTAREATLGLALVVWGIYFHDRKNFRLSTFLFLLSGVTYSAYRLLVPLLLVYKKSFKTLFIVLIVFGVLTLDPGSRLRAANVLNGLTPKTSLQSQQESNEIGQATKDSRVGWVLARIYHNKYALKVREYSQGYLQHFDLSYLFTNANPNFEWYKVPSMGLLPVLAVIPFIIGLINGPKYLIYFFLISAIPAALTIEIPNPIRHLAGFVPSAIFILIGIKYLEERANKTTRIILMSLLIGSSIYGYKQFFLNREFQSQTYSNQGYKEIVEYIGQNQDRYQKIVLEGDPYIFFLFWGQKFGFTQDRITVLDRQWGSVKSLGKLEFLAEESCPKTLQANTLYVCQGKIFPPGSKVVFTSYYNNLDSSYTLIRKDP